MVLMTILCEDNETNYFSTGSWLSGHLSSALIFIGRCEWGHQTIVRPSEGNLFLGYRAKCTNFIRKEINKVDFHVVIDSIITMKNTFAI